MTTHAAVTRSTPTTVRVATMVPARAASSAPRRGVHCRVGTMAPVVWSAVLVTTESASTPKRANIELGFPPSHAEASGGAPDRSLAASRPTSVPRPRTASAVTRTSTQLDRTLQIRVHSARPVRATTAAALIGLLPGTRPRPR